jgi:peptidyl-dipeptidase Dcp
MGNFVEQSRLLGLKPVVYNSLNVPPPPAGQPALMTFDEVTTMFHEFGHAMHGIFASQQYPSLSGTNTARDFVEFPSQFHENLATVPEILRALRAPLPDRRGDPARAGGQDRSRGELQPGPRLRRSARAALLDMEWHALTPAQGKQDVETFEAAALTRIGLDGRMIPRAIARPYFRHIWSNGYSAGYYSYIWTEMLAHDAWHWVETHGGPTRANGDHVRATFLGQGHTRTTL